MIDLVERGTKGSLPIGSIVSLVNLIDAAVASFERDRETAKLMLLRASALVRTDGFNQERGSATPRAPAAPGAMAAWQLRRVMGYIEAHLAEPITGEQLAELIGVSTGQMFRGFKISVGMTPFKYIAIRRVDAARQLMRTTSEPLSQIALACGLFDQSHFCRVFRRVMGQRPNEWRRQNAVGPSPSSSPEVGLRPSSVTRRTYLHDDSTGAVATY